MVIDNQKNINLIRNAIKNHDLPTLKELFHSFPSLIFISTPFGTWLHVAVSCGDLTITKYLINLGLDPNKKGGTFGGNSLNTACTNGNLAIVEYLLLLNVEMDISDPERNPLFGAVLSGDLLIVKKLIEYHINYKVSYTGNYMKNMDAEAFALERGEKEIANYLYSQKNNQ